MASAAVPSPAFGEANLSNCEREQIHLADSIQPHGALLVVREPDHVIVQISENAAYFIKEPKGLLGRPLATINGDLAQRVLPHLLDPLRDIARGVRCHIGTPPVAYDVLIHRPTNGGIVLELERAGAAIDLSDGLDQALRTIVGSASLPALCDETARLFKTLAGYDRVMVYRFDAAGHGEVFSEARNPELEAFLGNRYPSTDIPHIARRLYMRNRVRVLVDVDAAPVLLSPPVLSAPVLSSSRAIGPEQLDMSLCFLRASSPIHVQYLKNMGVRATLVVSLLVNGRLWGLVACHHYEPRFVHFELRAMCELLAEAVATRIAAFESFDQAQAELSVRRLEQRMIRAISRDGDWRSALFDQSRALLEPVSATGAALLFDGEVQTVGEVPGTEALRALGRWLDGQTPAGFVETSALGALVPELTALSSVASGLLALPISTTPGEYLIWMRPERIRTVTWGGNPFKPDEFDDDPRSLSPRRSFAQWHQVMEGTADPWTLADLAAARLIADTVTDVIIQFRSVRLLLAENQLALVRGQVEASAQAVLVADQAGRILSVNPAFLELLPMHSNRLNTISDVLPLFNDPAEVERRLYDLIEHRLAWRGEVEVHSCDGTLMPLLVRADPVFTGPDRILGFVLLCTDLTERRAAERARRRFQDAVLEQRRPTSGRLNEKADLMFRNHIAAIVENAQLAALEIADRIDPSHMPEMLEAVRLSVARTAEVLRDLLWHATGEEPKMSGKRDKTRLN